jgi:glycosyltransferase involved in cell wall biosynthesis
MRITIQLCTYNRANLLGRVLDGCFEQTVPGDQYEVVLVNDGSRDETPAVIAAAERRATCGFTVINQANAGLARGRNVGIERSRGERIIFIDDDILPTPTFVEEHLRSHVRTPEAVVRGAVINTESFDALPPPIWTLKNYSANYFWTSNVSVARETLDRVGHFIEDFREYGWEDIELGMRLRNAGAPGIFNKDALVFHHKPRPRATNVAGMLRQARAQARTAAQLLVLHPHWRVVLAIHDDPLQRTLHRAARALGVPARLSAWLGDCSTDRALSGRELGAARALVRETYFEELERAKAGLSG